MILDVANLHAYYGQSHILHGVDLDVGEGEIVSLLGRNGVGRSTTCKAIMGLVPASGTIRFRDRDIAGLRPDQVAHCGIGYVPENREIFPTLTVKQNLELGLSAPASSGAGLSRTSIACSRISTSGRTSPPACSPVASSRC